MRFGLGRFAITGSLYTCVAASAAFEIAPDIIENTVIVQNVHDGVQERTLLASKVTERYAIPSDCPAVEMSIVQSDDSALPVDYFTTEMRGDDLVLKLGVDSKPREGSFSLKLVVKYSGTLK